jgi:hypothetical protein
MQERRKKKAERCGFIHVPQEQGPPKKIQRPPAVYDNISRDQRIDYYLSL